MKRVERKTARARLGLFAGLTVFAVPGAFLVVGLMKSAAADPSINTTVSVIASAALLQNDHGDKIDPSRVMGTARGDCKKCHPSAVAAWMKSKHFRSEEKLFLPNAKKYAAALGISDADLKKGSLCINCHSTPQQTAGGGVEAISGVSCESCHGGAGGEDGWLNRHHVYASSGLAKREEETPEHRKARLEFCEKAGMIRPAQLSELAKNCYGCHIVDNAALVAAGHPAGSNGFDLLGWTSGEVRHNFFLDQSKNAEAPTLWMEQTGRTAQQRKRVKFVVGLLAELEVALRNRAKATQPTDAAFAGQMAARIGQVNGKLAAVGAAETGAAAGVVAPLFAKLFAPSPGDDKTFGEAADKIAEITKTFAEKHDGSDLAAVDGLMAASQPKGTPHQP